MNTSKLVEMYEENPGQFTDQQAFLDSVNAKNITQTVRTHVQIVDEERLISFAEMHGGPCTLRDLQDMRGFVRQKNFVPQLEGVFETVKQEMMEGLITTKAQLKSRLNTLITAL